MRFFFFFQAEDGIRDRDVTGVQTCALPISNTASAPSRLTSAASAGVAIPPAEKFGTGSFPVFAICRTSRSEERRVGKECRSRWSAYQYKKKRDKSSSQVVIVIMTELDASRG